MMVFIDLEKISYLGKWALQKKQIPSAYIEVIKTYV